jgi:hypothetical protein
MSQHTSYQGISILVILETLPQKRGFQNMLYVIKVLETNHYFGYATVLNRIHVQGDKSVT